MTEEDDVNSYESKSLKEHFYFEMFMIPANISIFCLFLE